MASFEVCFNWMMDNEDPRREYKAVPDVGGMAIAGINSHVFPGDYNLIEAKPQDQRGPMVGGFYCAQFWNKWFDQLSSDELAKRVFDASVNMGQGTAVKLLQSAVNTFSDDFSGDISEDGKLGPKTVAIVNALSGVPAEFVPGSAALVQVFKALRGAHYKAIVAADPSKSKYLSGWLARATK